MRTDEAVDIQGIRISRILGAGAGPQRSLHTRTFGGQGPPAIAVEDLLEPGIGDLGVGNANLALQPGLAQRIELFIHHRIHPTDEK